MEATRYLQDTIAAVSTPMGVGAVGMVRLSGPEAVFIASRLFRPVGAAPLESLPGYRGMLGTVYGPAGDVDEAVAFVYRAPKSYTGEDVVELSCHGGMEAVGALFRLCLEAGARAAGPGEFTRRAFLNGKMDLSQAEAVMDLISAKGEAGLRSALSARGGALSRKISGVAAELTERIAALAAWADYPEEDMEEVDPAALLEALGGMEREIKALLDTHAGGRILREGVDAVLAGKPNVGKSTLMNWLAGEEKSIVTEIPGTTRDVVEDVISIGRCVLRLSDTAGIRDTDDPVERVGVERARARLEEAQLILALFDASEELDGRDWDLLGLLEGRPAIAVVNKTDRAVRLDLEALGKRINRVVLISAREERGREDLEREILSLLELEELDPTAALVHSERQRSSLARAVEHLGEARAALSQGITLDAVTVCMESALDSLLEITGERVSDRVVDEVFSRFCVGK